MRHRIVIPAGALDQLDKLTVPEIEDLEPWEIRYLPAESVEVLNLADRRKWRIRLGQCGMGSCACDAVAWPADYVGPLPDPEPFDGWPFTLTGEQWDALAVECGRDVSVLGWDELLEAVGSVHGGAEA